MARRTRSALLALPAVALLLGASHRAFISSSRSPEAASTEVEVSSNNVQRRDLLRGMGLVASAAVPAAPAFALELYQDLDKGFEFTYPLGLQKSTVDKAYTVLLRDILEPLQYVAVRVTTSQRLSLDEVGSPEEVAANLMKDLVPEGAPQEVIKTESVRDSRGRRKDIIEFAYQWKFPEEMAKQLKRRRFQLHCKAVVQVENRKSYLAIIAAEENRWPSRGAYYSPVLDSFKVL